MDGLGDGNNHKESITVENPILFRKLGWEKTRDVSVHHQLGGIKRAMRAKLMNCEVIPKDLEMFVQS